MHIPSVHKVTSCDHSSLLRTCDLWPLKMLDWACQDNTRDPSGLNGVNIQTVLLQRIEAFMPWNRNERREYSCWNHSMPVCKSTVRGHSVIILKWPTVKHFSCPFPDPQVKKKWLLSGIDHLCPHPCGYSGYSCFKMVFPSPIHVQMAGLKHHELKGKKKEKNISTDRIVACSWKIRRRILWFFCDSPPPAPRGLELKWGQKAPLDLFGSAILTIKKI